MKYIAYYRVSTKMQGNSGLGLDSQKTAVKNFINTTDELIDEYQEVESGKNNYRIQLLKAIEHCQEVGATLLIAKLDRLSRNASFIFTLKDTQVQFKCVDMPEANSITIGIMAVLAQDERERISQRTKVALDELRKKGVKLGSPQNLTSEAKKKGLEVRMQNAMNNENNRKATAIIVLMRNENKNFTEIRNKLNDTGFKTRKNKTFDRTAVVRLYDRYIRNQEVISN